jgi:hypothetical protein
VTAGRQPGRGFTTPEVRAAAAKAGVDLRRVTATGPGEMFTLQDVQHAAAGRAAAASDPYRALYGDDGIQSKPLSAAAQQARAQVAAAAPRGARETKSVFADVTVLVDDYGRNPMVDDLRQALPQLYAMAVKDGPPPTLFASGDLPVMTASGLEPFKLMQLPWYGRHRAAAEPDRAKLMALFEDAAEDPAILLLTPHRANEEYVKRIRSWASGAAAATAQKSAANAVNPPS